MESPPYRQIILETIEALLKLQMKSVRLLLGRTDSPREATRRKGRKHKSLVDLAVEILTEEKRPVHVDELVELLRERHGRLTDRDSLSSALAKKDKQGLRVRRVAPASFAVRE